MSLPNQLRRAQQFAHRINRRISLRENEGIAILQLNQLA